MHWQSACHVVVRFTCSSGSLATRIKCRNDRKSRWENDPNVNHRRPSWLISIIEGRQIKVLNKQQRKSVALYYTLGWTNGRSL